MKKGQAERTHADHMSIIFSFKTRWCDRIKFKREPSWDYRKPLGQVKFDIFTSNSVRYLLNKVTHEPDINKTHTAFINVIKKAKFQSFNKRTITANKVKRLNDKLVWRERINNLAKLEKRLQNEKESNKVYQMRKLILRGPEDRQINDLAKLEKRLQNEKESNKVYQMRKVILKVPEDRQNYKVVDQKSGKVLEDLDEIMNHVLDYNVRNMEKVPPDAETEEILRKKAVIIDELLSDHNVERYPDKIPWEVFLKVMEKVTRQRKSCFRDICLAGATTLPCSTC